VPAGAIFALLEAMALPERVGGLLIDLDGTVTGKAANLVRS
jgi:hypothetical protein